MADTGAKRTVRGVHWVPVAGAKNQFRRTLQSIWCSLIRGETVLVLFKLYPFYLAQWISLHRCTNPRVTVPAVASINNAIWGHVAAACIEVQSNMLKERMKSWWAGRFYGHVESSTWVARPHQIWIWSYHPGSSVADCSRGVNPGCPVRTPVIGWMFH